MRKDRKDTKITRRHFLTIGIAPLASLAFKRYPEPIKSIPIEQVMFGNDTKGLLYLWTEKESWKMVFWDLTK